MINVSVGDCVFRTRVRIPKNSGYAYARIQEIFMFDYFLSTSNQRTMLSSSREQNIVEDL